MVLARVRGGAMISKSSTIQIFPNFGQGGGHRKSIFSRIQNSPNYPRGGGGQENYGLFPQFGTFFMAPLASQYYFLFGMTLHHLKKRLVLALELKQLS